MKKYDFSKYKNMYVIGSCHNGIDRLMDKVDIYLSEQSFDEKISDVEQSLGIRFKKSPRRSYDFNHSVLLALGNCNLGIGMNDIFFQKLNEINQKLSQHDCHLLFIRGENDNQDLFFGNNINLSNIKTISDYSLITFDEYNILAVGGNISVDRSWKKEHEVQKGHQMYWDNEKTIYDERAISAILKDNKIDFIVSISCPTFAPPSLKYSVKSIWLNADKKLQDDVLQERLVMDNIYINLLSNKNTLRAWIYGNNNNSDDIYINNIFFNSLGERELFSITNWIETQQQKDIEEQGDFTSDLLFNYDEDDIDE